MTSIHFFDKMINTFTIKDLRKLILLQKENIPLGTQKLVYPIRLRSFMKINEKMLSIPPYISTTWKSISALHMKGQELVVTLNSGESLTIPDLKQEVIDTIFLTHALYIDHQFAQEPSLPIAQMAIPNPYASNLFDMSMESGQLPFKLGDGSIGSIDAIGSISHHNPAQADLPELPSEILNKIVAITKIVAPDEPIAIPKPESDCNCVHCQISRAIHQGMPHLDAVVTSVKVEEPVTDEDLTFRQWDICQTGNKLYTVINRLDSKEKYSVYLGQPLGCTCGKQNCEHLLAVLKS